MRFLGFYVRKETTPKEQRKVDSRYQLPVTGVQLSAIRFGKLGSFGHSYQLPAFGFRL
jgi:hypothetical protein